MNSLNSVKLSFIVLGLVAVATMMVILFGSLTPEGYQRIDGKLVKQGREYDETYKELEQSCPYRKGTRENGAEILFCLHPVGMQSLPAYQVCPGRSGVKANKDFVELIQRQDTYITFGEERRSQRAVSTSILPGFCTEFRGPQSDGADIYTNTSGVGTHLIHLIVWRGNPYPSARIVSK